MTWRRTATGGWLSDNGAWSIRGPMWGKPMYWLYDAKQHCRYTPTGRYNDCVNFPTLAAAKKYAAEKVTAR